MSKRQNIIEAFRKGSLNRFEAFQYGDTCLNSTVSALKREGFVFDKVWENTLSPRGHEVHCVRYTMVCEPLPKGNSDKSKPIAANRGN